MFLKLICWVIIVIYHLRINKNSEKDVIKIKNEEILTIKATIEKKNFRLGVTFFYILCIDCTNFSVLFLFLFRPLDSIFSQNLPLNEKNKNCGLKG